MHVSSDLVVPIPATTSPICPAANSNTRPGLLVIGDGAVATICSSGPLAASHAVERIPTLAAALSRVRTVDRAFVGFDASRMRRAWYACLECEHAWITKRQW
jgi:hypothetical protein